MKLKKLALVLTGALVSLALVGCGGSNDQAKQESKVLRVGSAIDFAPFEFQDEGQKDYQGFDMDLIRAIAKEMGSEAEIQNIGFDGLIPALQAKNIDVIISGMTINDERKKNVLFSEPYYKSGLTIVVKKDNTDINGFKDLAGKTVAVQIGTTSAKEVKKNPDIQVKELNSSADTFLELKAGGVQAVVNDRPVNDYYIAKSGEQDVRVVNELLTSEDYGIAMAKDNQELQKKVDAALKKLKESGKYDEIYKKWFGQKAE